MTAGATAKTFASLLRSSQLIKRGDFRNSLVDGTIFHVVNNDLYVDFGFKFHAVVRKPQQDSKLYVRGAKVKLRMLDYEITDRFLGMQTDTSLLEADAVLVGLLKTPVGSKSGTKTTSRGRATVSSKIPPQSTPVKREGPAKVDQDQMKMESDRENK